MLTPEQREYLLPQAYNAALRAGAVILDTYADTDNYDIDLKSDHTPITLADRRSHTLIKEYLGRTRIPILSEEGREMLYEERRGWDLFWMVDPLDGTKEFIKGNGEFTVNIALMVDNRPELGVIYVPYIRRMYFCDKAVGSFRKLDVVSDPQAAYTYRQIMTEGELLPVANRRNSPIRIAVSRSHNTIETFREIDRLKQKHPDAQLVEQGSSYKFCLLAEGSVDYYIRTTHTSEWDTAAGELILEQTGGVFVSHPDGQKFRYNKESLLNPHFVCRSRFFV